MLRSFSLSVMAVLLMCSGVFACIGQAEGFSINASNIVQRVGGAGWAKSGNIVMVDQGQGTYTKGTVALQRQTGQLLQGAKAAGKGGTTTVLQDASIKGLQRQIVSTAKPGIAKQGQRLTVGLENIIRTKGGIGGAKGRQVFNGGQRQVIATPYGKAKNYQTVGATQFASVSANPRSNVTIVNTMNVRMGQGQVVTGPQAPPKP